MKRILALLVGLLIGAGAHAESFDFYQGNIGADAGVLLGVLGNDGDLNNVGVVELLLEGRGFTSYPADLNASLVDKSVALSGRLSAFSGNLKSLEQILFDANFGYDRYIGLDFGTKLAQLSGGAAAAVDVPVVVPPARRPVPEQPAGDARAAMLQQLLAKRLKEAPEPEPVAMPRPLPEPVIVPPVVVPLGGIPAAVSANVQTLLDYLKRADGSSMLDAEQTAKLIAAGNDPNLQLYVDMVGRGDGAMKVKIALTGYLSSLVAVPAAPVGAPLPQPAMPGAGPVEAAAVGQNAQILIDALTQLRAFQKTNLANQDDAKLAGFVQALQSGSDALKVQAALNSAGAFRADPVDDANIAVALATLSQAAPLAAPKMSLLDEMKAAQAGRANRFPVAAAAAVRGMTDEEIVAAGEFGDSAQKILKRVGHGLNRDELTALKKLPDRWLQIQLDDIEDFDDKAAKELLDELKEADIFKTRGEFELRNLRRTAGV